MDEVRCPLIWPYRLGEEQLRAYLRSVERILRSGQFREHDGYSGEVARRLHQTVGLPADWSVLPVRWGTDALVLALQAAGVSAAPRRVRAVIGVDNFGSLCDWQGISLLCRQRRIPFILDSCESLGARHPGGAPSDYANLVAYSFSFSKPIHAAGTGGALCGPTELIDRIANAPEFAAWATTMPEINASFLLHAWPDLDGVVEHLQRIYRRYQAGLRQLGVIPQELLKEVTSAWILAPFRFPRERFRTGISELIHLLAGSGIVARRSFPPQSRRFGLPPGRPTTTRLSGELLCLPTGATMPLEWADEVVERLAEASGDASRPGPAGSGR